MDVKSRSVTAVFLVKNGELPFAKLLNRNIIEKLVDDFAFAKGVDVIQAPNQVPTIVLKNGILVIDTKQLAILRLQFEPRKIIIDVEGSSEEAEYAYRSLVKSLIELSEEPDDQFLNPLLTAIETTILSHLNFPAERLITPELVAMVDKYINGKSQNESFVSRTNPAQVSFQVEYLPSDFDLSDYRIGLSRKELTIGPLKGYPLANQMYESKAPLDTTTHESLLIELEQMLN